MALPSGLTEKLGPIPTWQWIALGGMAFAAIAFLKKRKSTTPLGPIILQPATAGAGGPSDFAATAGPLTATQPSSADSEQPGDVQSGSFVSSAAGQSQGDYPPCTPQSQARCTIMRFVANNVPFYPNSYTGDWVASYIPGNSQGFPQTAQEALARLGLTGRPDRLPVTDPYGNVGMQTTAAAVAGGYWGANGQWVATPTPWEPLAGQPPAGSGARVTGPTVTTGAQQIPQQGSIPATPASYLSIFGGQSATSNWF